ncbi:MAG: glycosyltransferase family 2 protein [Bacteriovoracales bacterium]|nr:glycosyltransferase family 2 protein [Bacteriovoracales bacterium]
MRVQVPPSAPKNMSQVSIIIPCYNCEKFIGQTIESVLAQTYTNWELILVDDKSDDKTLDILNKFKAKGPERIKVLPLEENSKGPARPRNIGLKRAASPYVAFLDSDDAWHPQKLEWQLEFMQRENIPFSCTQRICFDDKIDFDGFRLEPGPLKTKEVFYGQLLKKNIISCSSVIVEKRHIQNLGFKEEPSFVAVEDYALWLNILKKDVKCFKIMAPLLFYRLSKNSISSEKITMALKTRNVLHAQMQETSKPKWLGNYYWINNLAHSAINALFKKAYKKPL